MLAVFFTAAAANNTLWAATIYQCEQPDGTIEFSNQGCSKSSTLENKKRYRHKKLYNIKKSRSPNRLNISHLQNKILKSTSADEMEKLAKQITDKVFTKAQQGQLRIACNAVAATYAKIARQLERKKRNGESVSQLSASMQMLFEEIMLSEATLNSADDLNKEIALAWEKYHTSRQQTVSPELALHSSTGAKSVTSAK